MKRSTIVFAIVIAVALIGVPLLINCLGNIITIKTGASFGEWLGFWGSYLGGFVTLIGVYLAFKLDNEKEIQRSVYLNLELLEEVLGILEHIWKRIDNDNLTTLDLKEKKEQLIQVSQKSKTLHPTLQSPLKEIESKVWSLYSLVQIYESYNLLKRYSMIDQENIEENKQALYIKAEEVRNEIISFRRIIIAYKAPL